jgi:hypothetical protein
MLIAAAADHTLAPTNRLVYSANARGPTAGCIFGSMPRLALFLPLYQFAMRFLSQYRKISLLDFFMLHLQVLINQTLQKLIVWRCKEDQRVYIPAYESKFISSDKTVQAIAKAGIIFYARPWFYGIMHCASTYFYIYIISETMTKVSCPSFWSCIADVPQNKNILNAAIYKIQMAQFVPIQFSTLSLIQSTEANQALSNIIKYIFSTTPEYTLLTIHALHGFENNTKWKAVISLN